MADWLFGFKTQCAGRCNESGEAENRNCNG